MGTPANRVTPIRIAPHRALRIGAWLFDLDAGRLVRESDGADERLAPKTAQVLEQLASAPGQVVTREQLFERVWPNAVPSPDLINHAIRELRRALGDDLKSPQYIETIPKVGYRLITAVSPATFTPGEDEPTVASSPPREPPTERTPTLALACLAALALLTVAVPLSRRPADDAVAAPAYALDSLRYVTAEPGRENMPRLSPDGNLVAYGAGTLGTRRQRIFLRGTEGARSYRVTEETGDSEYDEHWPTFSRDGSRIAFLRLYYDGSCDVHVVGLLGGRERNVYECPAQVPGSIRDFFDWAADDRALFVSRPLEDGAPARIVKLDVERGAIDLIDYTPRSSDPDLDPRVSPDGRLLAFRRGTVPFSDLYVMPIEGGEARRLTDSTSLIRGYDWLPDGSGLVVSSDLGGRQALYTIALDDPKWRPLGELDAFFPDIAALRDRVVFQRITFESRVVEYPLDTAQDSRSITGTSANDMTAQYSPDGSRIVFLSTRSGASAIWLHDTANGGVRLLAQPDQGVPEYPRWSPDGTLVAFTARSGGAPAVFVVDVASGVVRRATPDGVSARYATFAPDGRALYFAQRVDDAWHAARIELAPGSKPELVANSEGATNPVPSADGRALYFVRLGDPTLVRLDFATGERRAITQRVHPRSLESFVLRGEFVYYLGMGGTAPRISLFRAPIDGGEPEFLRNFDAPIGEVTLALSEDADRVLVTIADREDSDLVVAELAPSGGAAAQRSAGRR